MFPSSLVLKTANETFNTTYLKRTKETSTKPEQSLSATEGDKRWKCSTPSTVAATQRILPKPVLPGLMAQINTLFDEYNQLLATRTGRRGSNPEA